MKKIIAFLLILAILVPQCAVFGEKPNEYLQEAVRDGIIFGNEAGELCENSIATRAEFLSLAVRFLGLSGGENAFSDVNAGDWFADSVSAAFTNGIFSGFDDGTARPLEKITVQDAVTVLGRYYSASNHKKNYYGVSDYARDYFACAYESGFFEGFIDALMNPKRGITKGEIITLLYRYKNISKQALYFENGYPRLSQNKTFSEISFEYAVTSDCDIYYSLCEDSKNYNWIKIDNENSKFGRVSIKGDKNSKYDLYVKAVSKTDNGTQTCCLKSVIPCPYVSGNGSTNSPYVIYDEQQLRGISAEPDKCYVIKNDIELSDEWTPIENFSGTIVGNNCKITNLKIKNDGEKVGFFSEINGGTAVGLCIKAEIKADKSVGIIAGVNNDGVIEGCSASGYAEAKTNDCGAICGVNRGEIRDCLSAAYTVKAGAYAGGISGQNYGIIENCLSGTESVFSDMYAGGISGTNVGGRIKKCVAANCAVYNTMTYNSGKIATNQNGGITKDNYSLDEMVSNTAASYIDEFSQNGYPVSIDMLSDFDFYDELGWSKSKWQMPSDGYRLIYPRNTAEPNPESGKTIYKPKKISSEAELAKIKEHPDWYYVLTRNISINNDWKSGALKFTGTLDGNGHTISGMKLDGGAAFFESIDGGTVKNINFANVKCDGASVTGIICCSNSGYIENCVISGEISSKANGIIGCVAGENSGRIAGCSVNADIDTVASELIIGGITAKNTGELSGNYYAGNIMSNGKNVIVGGICGQSKEGYISENYAFPKISVKNKVAHISGICGLSENDQIYKCASSGNTTSTNEEVYVGGICAMADGSTVYNCFSSGKANVNSISAYVGGIAGKVSETNIQNTYSGGTLMTFGKSYTKTGGICGFAELSFVMQNVALNPSISSYGDASGIIADYEMSEVSDNYAVANMFINSQKITDSDKNGISKSISTLKDISFFTKELSEGGILGWDSEAWKKTNGYDFPTLTNVKGMSNLINPVYK